MSQKKPVLYFLPTSPPCRAVVLSAAAIGVELDIRHISLIEGEHLKEEFTKINPQHTVPTLDDNGVILFDSHVICSYLADKYAKDDSLYPKDLVRRSLVQTRLYFDTGYMFARLRFLVEPVLYQGQTEYPEEKKEYLRKAYDILEAFLKDGPYMCGNDMTIADLSLVSTASSVLQLVPYDAQKHKKVLVWLARMEKLPYYEEANKKGSLACMKRFNDVLLANQAKSVL